MNAAAMPGGKVVVFTGLKVGREGGREGGIEGVRVVRWEEVRVEL